MKNNLVFFTNWTYRVALEEDQISEKQFLIDLTGEPREKTVYKMSVADFKKLEEQTEVSFTTS